ncbi:MAG: hypothetical protein JWP02_3437 [Acidimicrobiales bacterium]|nr:hypothetical protein [Acidimicrobiales bacterium]
MVVAAGATLPAMGLKSPGPTRGTRATAQPAPVANALKRWAATNGGGPKAQTPTSAQALAVAADYDLILATKKSYPPYVAAMRQAKPGLQLVAYLNGTYAQSDEGSAYPDAWYARDANGARVRSKRFGNYLMDVTSQGWIQSRAQTCADYVAQSGYDGCYLDMLGNATVGAGYDTTMPVNPATHKPWTRPQWIGATSKLAAAVKTALPNLLIVGNGLTNGNQYFDPSSGPTSLLVNGIAGANAQGFMRSESDKVTTFRTASVWKHDVDMLVDAGARGRSVLAMTKVGTAATPAQLQQVHRYALASFLLGTDGAQYFYFSPNGNDDGVDAPDTPDDHVNAGMPLGPYTAQANGAYVRPFSAGYAAVNPGTAAVTVNLGGPYVDLDGRTVQQATLAPHTGMVFTKAATTTTTATTSATATTSRTPRTPRTSTTVARSKTSSTKPTTSTTVCVTTTTSAVAAKAAALSPRRCRPRPTP